MRFLAAMVLVVVPVLSGALAQGVDDLPPGWHRTGRSTRWEHTMQLDTNVKRSGASSLRIESTRPTVHTVAEAIQGFRAEPYRGTRLHLRGFARVSGVSRWAGLVLGVVGPTRSGADNMIDRPFVGTADWTVGEVVLDVPDDAIAILIGAVILGPGTLWIDDFQLDTVPRSIATTKNLERTRGALSGIRNLLLAPTNLGFEREQ